MSIYRMHPKRSEPIVTAVHARHLVSRLRGLLGRKPLAEDAGLLLTPCSQVHTVGMRYALDVVFLDADGVVLKCISSLRPWRAAGAWGAKHTLELATGSLQRLGLRPGDRLMWVPVGATPTLPRDLDHEQRAKQPAAGVQRMKKTILSLSPLATAFNLSAVFALSILIFVVPALGLASRMKGGDVIGFTSNMAWMLPIFSFTVMFIMLFIAVLLYNLFAKLTGGIRLELGDEGT